MRRSESWPQIFVLPLERDEIGECQPGIEHNSDCLTHKEDEYDELKMKVANYEIHFNDLTDRVEQMEMENQYLNKENQSLKEENRASSERVKFLEHEWDQEKLRVRELECVIADLQKEYVEVENDKRNVTEELSTQRTNFAELQCSKKNLEGQVQQLQESTEWRRMEQDRVRDLIEESDLVKAQLQDMEQQLQAMEKEAQDAKLLHKENHEMQLQISEMVQQNIKLNRQLNNVTQSKDHLEQCNLVLQDEMENLKMEGSYSRESSLPHIHHILQEDGEGKDGGEEDYIGGDTYDGDDDDNDKEFKMQILPMENHLSGTPPAISLAEEFKFSIYGACSQFEDKVEQPMSKSTDALDEYIHLTAVAVKIRFHMVPISSTKLIERANEYPFYRMHDELTKYMEEKLKEQESSSKKPEQDVHQEQESACISKEQDQQCPTSQPNIQPSVFNKVRNLFRQRSVMEPQKKEVASS